MGGLELFPDSATVDDGGELTIGGLRATDLAAEHGTPLVVYCEDTVRGQARTYRAAAPEALVVYGTKAFPNVALLRLLASEGLGADVSTLGELTMARAAGLPPERLVVHGNNKSDRELEAARGALVVLDAPDELERARAAGIERLLVRITLGIEADTHEAIRTGHHGSKFGVTEEQARALIARDPEILGLHIHIGSQLRDTAAIRTSVGALARLAEDIDGWSPRVLDLGGGLGIRSTLDEHVPSIADFVGALLESAPTVEQLVLEPGRSLVGRAGVTLYRVGAVKETGAGRTWAAVDGGMSDNPRPQLYGARHTAVVAGRAGAEPDATYGVAGEHCESGDVLIESVELPSPRRGDVLAVPGTGAYTLAMASNYNGVPRPAAVLVRDGESEVIRRRETIEDLLRFET
ncbi:MAG TPA: diaminopimelate decarboxylase [Gaiellaceae bacterium]